VAADRRRLVIFYYRYLTKYFLIWGIGILPILDGAFNKPSLVDALHLE